MNSGETREKGLFWRAAGASAGLGVWFFLVYGFCNWWTSRLPVVGTFYWDWEKHMPFIPEFIVPYMSMDLLFVGAFLLCRSRHELGILSWRIFLIVSASGICFLLWPLQFGLVRPDPVGWTAPWFAVLHQNDLPFNLAPSLHIGLRSLVWITYGRHLRGMLRGVTKVWFIMVGVSTLLVWQHHLIDVVTGFLMAWAIVAAIPDRAVQPGPMGWRGEVTSRHRRLGSAYLLGALGCALLSLLGGGWVIMAWLAVALLIRGVAYWTANPRWLQKSSGHVTPAAEWLLLPVNLATWLWQICCIRGSASWSRLTSQVYFGAKPEANDARRLAAEGCVAVVDLTAESNRQRAFGEGVAYYNAATLDLTRPSDELAAMAVEFIESHRHHGVVYVHCRLGLGRSAWLAAVWLARSGVAASFEEAMERVRAVQPRVVFPRG